MVLGKVEETISDVHIDLETDEEIVKVFPRFEKAVHHCVVWSCNWPVHCHLFTNIPG
jgi:hypothetical protein